MELTRRYASTQPPATPTQARERGFQLLMQQASVCLGQRCFAEHPHPSGVVRGNLVGASQSLQCGIGRSIAEGHARRGAHVRYRGNGPQLRLKARCEPEVRNFRNWSGVHRAKPKIRPSRTWKHSPLVTSDPVGAFEKCPLTPHQPLCKPGRSPLATCAPPCLERNRFAWASHVGLLSMLTCQLDSMPFTTWQLAWPQGCCCKAHWPWQCR